MTEEKQEPKNKETEKQEVKIEEKPVETKPAETPKEKGEKPVERIEKEFIIPLRKKFKKTVRYKKTPKAIKAIKEFLVRHMKVYDRDLNKIKLDKYLNEFVWTRGIQNPPSKIRVRAIVDGENIRAELVELPERLKFRKAKIEKRAARATAQPAKKVPDKKEEVPKQTEEEKTEEKEKKAAVVEAGQKMEKADAKKQKHQTKMSKQPKRQKRMALAK